MPVFVLPTKPGGGKADGTPTTQTHRAAHPPPPQNKKQGNQMKHIITGPPCAGKTTYLQNNAQPGDIRIDLDHLINTITGMPQNNHKHADDITDIMIKARRKIIAEIMKLNPRREIWIIDSKPTPQRLAAYKQAGAQIINLKQPKDVLLRRAHERPHNEQTINIIEHWDDEPETKRKPTTRERGYGWKHIQNRKRLMFLLDDGAPCPVCHKPRYKDNHYKDNWDGYKLEADHENNDTSQLANRLIHKLCNLARMGGRGDAGARVQLAKTQTQKASEPKPTKQPSPWWPT